MKRKQIALLLSLVLSVSPMAEGMAVWGAEFTDGTTVEQIQREETTEEVSDFASEEAAFSTGEEQNGAAAFSDEESGEEQEARYEVGLNYSTGAEELLPGHTVTVNVDLYWRYIDEDGNERRDNFEGDYEIKLKCGDGDIYTNDFITATVSEDGKSLIITAKDKGELDPDNDNFGDIPISILVNEKEVVSENVGISVTDRYYIIRMSDDLESSDVTVGLGDELDLSSYGIKTLYYDAEHTEGEEDSEVYYEVEYDENIWKEISTKENGLPVLERRENDASEFVISARKRNNETEEEGQKVSETQFWIHEMNYEADLEFSYGSGEQDVLLYGENVRPLTLTVVPTEGSDSDLKGFTVDWKVEQYIDNNDEDNMKLADCIEYSIASSGNGITNNCITLSAKEAYDFTNKNLRLRVTATVSKDGKEVTGTATSLWVNEAVENINFPESVTLLPGWGMDIDSIYNGWKCDEENLFGTDIYAHVTDVEIEDPDGVLMEPNDEEGYHLQAARNGKTGEVAVTLRYYTSKSEEGEEGKEADKTYTFRVSVKVEKYYCEYSYNSETSRGFGIILPDTETVVTTSLYNQSYDIEEDGENQTEIKDYQLKLAGKEDGTPAWDANLVSVTVDGNKLVIKANSKTGETEIPVEFMVNGETVLTENIYIGVEKNICYISSDELTDKDGKYLNINVGESLDLSKCGIETHQLTVSEGENKDEILDTTLGDEFRYRVEYNKDAWKSSLKDDESGLPVLTRTAFYGTPVIVIAEKKFQSEEGESDWEEVNRKEYWFDGVYYDMDFEYSYGDRDNARVYTDKGLTLTLQTEPELDLSNKMFDVEWNVYRYNEVGEQVDASDLVTIEKSGAEAVLTAEPGHSGEYFQVEAVVTVDGKTIAQCGNEIRIQDPVYWLDETQDYMRILKGAYFGYVKDDSGKIWMTLYEENGNCPDGRTTKVQVTYMTSSKPDIFEMVEKDDRIDIHAVNLGIAELTVSLADKDGNELDPVTITLEAVEAYTWMENRLTGNSDTGEILPGESTKIETKVVRLSKDENGKTVQSTFTAGKDYKLEFYGYDTNLISVKKDGTVTANSEECGYTWLGIRAVASDDPEKVFAEGGVNIQVKGRYYVIQPKDQEEIYLQSDGKENIINLQAIVYGIKNPSGRQDTEGRFEIDEEDFANGDLNVAIKDNALMASVRLDAAVLNPGSAYWYDIPVKYVKNGEIVAETVYTAVRCNHTEKETDRISPSCSSNGYVNYKCKTCGYTWQETLGAYGHSWNSGVVTKEPICGTDGVKTYTCTDCGSTYTEIIKAAGEHKWDEGAVTKNATCTEDGVKTYTCTVCKETKTEVIPAAHTWSKWKTKSAATVFSAKVQEHICSVCQETETRTTGEKLAPKATLSARSLKLKVKQKTTAFKITGMAKGDYVKSWKSSNTDIVKVSGRRDGTCTIKAQGKTGTATITVTFASGLKKTIKVKVQKSIVRTTAISGIAKKKTLKKGKTLKLKPVLTPITSGEKITYKSSDTEIAKVSEDGIVTALKPGTVTITVQSGKQTVTCKITVKK